MFTHINLYCRFHSSVVSIELWKEVYYDGDDEESSENRSTDRSTSTESPDRTLKMTKIMNIDKFSHDDKIEIDA